MRFALIGPVYPFRGGIAHYTTMLCRALRERGHDVLLVSFKRQYPRWLFPGQSDRDPSERPLKADDARYWIDSLNPITWLTAFWRMRRYQPDAIVVQWWTTFWAPAWFVLGALNRCLLRRPVLFICHNVLPHETHHWDPFLARAVLRWGSRFTVQSRAEEQRLLSLLPGVRTTVAPLPVFDLLADQLVPKAEARKRLDLPPDVPVLLFFGIVREYKGLQDLLVALPQVQARVGRVMLLVAGEFWEGKRSYLELIERLRIDGSVVIKDRYLPNEEVALCFSAADLLVAPYRQVTGSAAVQMARGMGVPVVTTDLGGMQEIIGDGQAGVLVPPGDSDALAASIVRRLSEVSGETVGRGGQRERERNTWQVLLDAVEDAAMSA